jgi:alpha-mannosidase
MTIRRASVMLPASELEEFPTHLTGEAAADLLAAWTAVWHPAIIHVTGQLPAWHPASEPPDPAALEGELVVIPSASREQMPPDWTDRLRATSPRNPMAVEARASRDDTVHAILSSAEILPDAVSGESVADFFALGFAHLQIGLLTRAMRYSSILDEEQFAGAVISAAAAAVAGDREREREEIGRAFDRSIFMCSTSRWLLTARSANRFGRNSRADRRRICCSLVNSLSKWPMSNPPRSAN